MTSPRGMPGSYDSSVKSRLFLGTLVLALSMIGLAGCDVYSVGPTPGPTQLALRTQPSPGTNDICSMAIGGGSLVVDPVSGLGVADSAGHVTHVYWPFGYTARPDHNRVGLISPQGRIIARVADVITMTGGYGLNADWYACQLQPITLLV